MTFEKLPRDFTELSKMEMSMKALKIVMNNIMKILKYQKYFKYLLFDLMIA